MKGFVFISGSENVLRFWASGAFKALEACHDLTYVVLRSEGQLTTLLNKSLADGRPKVKWVDYYPERFRRWQELFNISCILYEDRSPSFAVRNQESLRRGSAKLARLERKLARPGAYERHRDAAEQYMGLHPDILALTLRERPDFFVLPSALLDGSTDDVLQIAAKLAIPTLLLVAGWDNLSSKGLLYHQPTMMGVWGEQSKRHAVEVQNADADRVYVIGSPHYEHFRISEINVDRAALRSSWGVPAQGHLVLFAGTFRRFDETQLLQEMDHAIDAGTLPAMQVIYRPHPWRANRRHEESFFDHRWRHVTMDPQMVDAYRDTKEKGIALGPKNSLYRMAHLARVYQAVDCVISPMSTVLLEALLFGLPTMAVAFGDEKHSWSADKVSRMLHFKELYEVPGVIVCRDRANFSQDVQHLVSQVGDNDLRAALRQSTHYFVYQDNRSYAERAASLVETMLSRVERPPAYDSVQVKPGKRFLMQGFLRNMWQRNIVFRAWQRAVRTIRQGVSR